MTCQWPNCAAPAQVDPDSAVGYVVSAHPQLGDIIVCKDHPPFCVADRCSQYAEIGSDYCYECAIAARDAMRAEMEAEENRKAHDTAEQMVTTALRNAGWEVARRRKSGHSAARYLTFVRGDDSINIRLADHDQTQLTWDCGYCDPDIDLRVWEINPAEIVERAEELTRQQNELTRNNSHGGYRHRPKLYPRPWPMRRRNAARCSGAQLHSVLQDPNSWGEYVDTSYRAAKWVLKDGTVVGGLQLHHELVDEVLWRTCNYRPREVEDSYKIPLRAGLVRIARQFGGPTFEMAESPSYAQIDAMRALTGTEMMMYVDFGTRFGTRDWRPFTNDGRGWRELAAYVGRLA